MSFVQSLSKDVVVLGAFLRNDRFRSGAAEAALVAECTGFHERH